MKLDPNIWGPRYWFFLHTAAMSYPIKPNDTIRKKFYDFIHNFPILMLDPKIASSFSDLLEKYPVSPYLDSKDSLVRWTHFIHNKINKKLEKDQISLGKFYTEYYKQYETVSEKQVEYVKTKRHIVYAALIVFIGIIIFIVSRQ